MASTYSFADIVNYVGQEYPRLMNDAFAPFMIDQANSLIWNEADWRVSLTAMTPFFLVPKQQDYGAPDAPIPTDFYGIRKADLIFNGNEPAWVYAPLEPKRTLDVTAWQGLPEEISYEQSISKFRLNLRPPSAIGGADWQVNVTYKKNPTKISASILESTKIPFDDKYLMVFVEAMRYIYYGHNKESEKAAAQLAGPLHFWLEKMKAQEAINLGSQNLSPKRSFLAW